jgi:hypothetical protein
LSGITNERLSDSPFVEAIWHGIAGEDGSFIAPADGRWELIVKRHEGKASLLVSGPVTKAVASSFDVGMEILSIKFKLGTFMPPLPIINHLDTQVALPEATSKSFWLNGTTWQLPNFENADTFINRLARDGLLAHDEVVNAVLQNQPQAWSIHTVRRRFLKATGFTQNALRQIERARHAAALLAQGVSILDTVYEAGYFDQPHLTRSLKRFIGHTPAQLLAMKRPG